MRLVSLITSTVALLLTIAGAQAQPTLNLPPRPADAPTGSQFYDQIRTLGDNDREQRIINQIARGNVPDFMRTLVPVTASAVINGQNTSVTLHVTPDYIAIGSNSDYFRMPMSAPLAQQVADLLECSLPTRKIVNDIYTAAAVKLAPVPFNPATYDIDSVEVFWLSNQAIQNQLAQGGHAAGLLVGGTKKDVVVTAQLPLRPPPPRVAIYGWHQLNGQPIQPLSLVHSEGYEDYSHGIRLVWNQVATSAGTRSIPQMLADPTLHPLVSDEGSFTSSRYPITNPHPITLSDNLILNGSFEEPFVNGVGTAWERWTAPGSATITFGRATVNRVDGAASQYWARTDTTPFDGGIRQRVSVEVGARYRLAARMKRQSTLAGTQMAVGYDPAGGDDPLAGSVVYTSLMAAANDTWATYSADFTAAANSVVVFARGGHTGTTGGTNSYFYTDAFSLYLLERPSVGDASNGWLVR
jgi:hypothetical protein